MFFSLFKIVSENEQVVYADPTTSNGHLRVDVFTAYFIGNARSGLSYQLGKNISYSVKFFSILLMRKFRLGSNILI